MFEKERLNTEQFVIYDIIQDPLSIMSMSMKDPW